MYHWVPTSCVLLFRLMPSHVDALSLMNAQRLCVNVAVGQARGWLYRVRLEFGAKELRGLGKV